MSQADIAPAVERREEERQRTGIPFMALRPGVCHFPLGGLSDPPERFCGQPAAIGSPYCPECRRRAYVQIGKR